MMLLFYMLCLIGVPFALSIANWIQVAPVLIKKQVTWPMAQNYCKENHLDLYTLKNSSDKAKLYRELAKHNEVGPVWVGLYNDLDSWYWSYNHLPLKNITLRNFEAGSPNNAYGNVVCGAIKNTAEWFIVPCQATGPYICYDATKSPANRFVGYGSSISWYDAQAACRSLHTDLASTTTQDDMNLIKQVMANLLFLSAWIGLTRDTWKWSDGTDPSYLPWEAGQPDNSDTWENCGGTKSGLLVDQACTNPYYFACSDYLHRTQYVKLQIKTDERILDPVVQSAILDLIIQKLEVNGMSENTTASWKVQANGKIFNKIINDRTADNTTNSTKECTELYFVYND